MKKFDQINVIPFIDIMLVLLAIVLMTATFISQGKIAVTLPEVNEHETLTSNDITQIITINEQGEFFYDNKPSTLAQLDQIFQSISLDENITLKVDANVAFQKFVTITDLLAKYQLNNISVITDKSSATKKH